MFKILLLSFPVRSSFVLLNMTDIECSFLIPYQGFVALEPAQ